MADLYWTHCNGCHQMADCLPHEDEFLCVGGDDEEGCYNRIRDAQMAQAREDYLRREQTCPYCGTDECVPGCNY